MSFISKGLYQYHLHPNSKLQRSKAQEAKSSKLETNLGRLPNALRQASVASRACSSSQVLQTKAPSPSESPSSQKPMPPAFRRVSHQPCSASAYVPSVHGFRSGNKRVVYSFERTLVVLEPRCNKLAATPVPKAMKASSVGARRVFLLAPRPAKGWAENWLRACK